MASVHEAPAEVEYPESDGKPMAETPVHRDNMIALIDVLRVRFAGDPMIYVSGNMFLYFERGNPRKCVAPDVFVARARADVRRRVYKTWEEGGRGPELVIEVTSPSTRDEDMEEKLALYRDTLRVPEYFLFDPLHEYLDPPLRGYRLVGGQYEAIEPVDERLPSAVLGLHFEAGETLLGFEAGERLLRLYDPVSAQTLLTSPEARAVAERAWEDAEQGRAQEHAARLAAEEELAQLRRELNELRGRSGGEGA
ncbi:MAG: Uma2 family endonuclease [Isosphaeraceae bacterium]|nr:Uma2 family endonuclease [Isosphaeraceae bacterium]